MDLLRRFLKLIFQRVHFILIGMLVCALTVVVLLYVINPYDVKSNNIRPRIFGLDIYRIPSRSMQPLLNPGDIIVVSNKAYLEADIKRNEIIVFNKIQNKNSKKTLPFIKRVIAISGDLLKIEKGNTFVNGKKISESYIKDSNRLKPYSTRMSEISIPKGQLFVLGDNRDNSNDSRIFGPISISDVVGKATDILYSAEGVKGNLGKK
ncbi:signal peptidase I [Cocleimonas sp. KMM 6892]|uniref:signal peptidase I n=2 Tax=Cocleimonas TaxID=998014 RepID=UPI002DB9F9C9|nr:signal peptidase I [Cocleimonas sp. KMM 6892]